MKKKVIVYAIVFVVFISCCSACSVSEKKQNENLTYSQQTTEEQTTSTVTDESTADGTVDSNAGTKKAEKISSKMDKMFQNATNNTPVVTINGRVITEFEYLIFKWMNSHRPNVKEEVIRSVLISQEMKKMNIETTEDSKMRADRIITWLRYEGSFTSAESETRYKISKKELVDIYEGVMEIESANWDFEDIFFKKLVDGTLGEIDASLQEACDEYKSIQVDVDAFKVSYKRLEDCYQKTLNNYLDLLKDRSEIVYGNK